MREAQLFISASSQSIIVPCYCISARSTDGRITVFLQNNPLAQLTSSSLHFLEKLMTLIFSVQVKPNHIGHLKIGWI